MSRDKDFDPISICKATSGVERRLSGIKKAITENTLGKKEKIGLFGRVTRWLFG